MRNRYTKGWRFSGPESVKSFVDVPDHKITLTEEGYKQAKESGEKITGIVSPDVIITSGYERTKQTLEGILEGSATWKHIPVVENLLIRERENGYVWSMLNDSHEKHFPYIQNYWDQVGPLFSRPVGGESILDLIEKRLYRFFDEINKEYAGKKVCLVTHGRVITGVRMLLENMSIDEVEEILHSKTECPKNVGLTVYAYNPWINTYKLKQYNKTYYKID